MKTLFILIGIVSLSPLFAQEVVSPAFDDGDTVTLSAQSAAAADPYCPGNSTASQVCRLTNEKRARYGLKPLRLDPTLSRIARNWTDEMDRRNARGKITHGTYEEYAARAISYGAYSENLAWRGYPSQNNPRGAVEGLMRSPGHRANMLNPSIRRIGVGHTSEYWVQEFGK